jgi:hypothetical protein
MSNAGMEIFKQIEEQLPYIDMRALGQNDTSLLATSRVLSVLRLLKNERTEFGKTFFDYSPKEKIAALFFDVRDGVPAKIRRDIFSEGFCILAEERGGKVVISGEEDFIVGGDLTKDMAIARAMEKPRKLPLADEIRERLLVQ